jgi:hypothetical protein
LEYTKRAKMRLLDQWIPRKYRGDENGKIEVEEGR